MKKYIFMCVEKVAWHWGCSLRGGGQFPFRLKEELASQTAVKVHPAKGKA
jgi:hypothetical protein